MCVKKLILLCLVASHYLNISCVVVNPTTQSTITICSTTKETVKIKDPFLKRFAAVDGFDSMKWTAIFENQENVDVAIFHPLPDLRKPESYATYEFWGLEIIHISESGQFNATLEFDTFLEHVSVTVIVEKPPQLISNSMYMMTYVDHKTSYRVFQCGEFAHLGQPQVKLFWTSTTMHTIPYIYLDGFARIYVAVGDVNVWTCAIVPDSEAYKCIPKEELYKFYEVNYGEEDRDDRLILDEHQQILSLTRCSEGLLDKTDKYVFKGTLTATHQVLAKRPKVYFQLRGPSKRFQYKSICSVVVGEQSCGNTSRFDDCYCRKVTEDQFHLFIERRAEMRYGGHILRLWWPSDGSDIRGQPSNAYPLPKIFQQLPIEISIVQNNKAIDLEDCTLELTVGHSYTFILCAINLNRGRLSIKFGPDDTEATYHRANCTARNVHVTERHMRGHFTFSYTEEPPGCGRQESIKCLVDKTHSPIFALSFIFMFCVCGIALVMIIIYIKYRRNRKLVVEYVDDDDSESKDAAIPHPRVSVDTFTTDTATGSNVDPIRDRDELSSVTDPLTDITNSDKLNI